MREQILAALAQYGSPVLFVVVMIGAIGVPLPVNLLLVVTGSLVAQGTISLPVAITLAAAGAVAGDQIGYAIGRWGGTALMGRLAALLGGAEHIARAESRARRWGGAGVFLSRWLLTPLGGVINFASGMAAYPWHHFLVWDILGETLGAVLYIELGRIFSDRVLALSDLLSNSTWAVGALFAALWLGWRLWRSRRPHAG